MLVTASLFLVMSMITSEREIAFKTPDGLELHGTFVAPTGATAERRQALLLLPGSGPTDRDGNQPGLQTDLLKSLAATLAEKGVATFRFDKRAVHTNAAQWPKDPAQLDEFFSYEHHLTDAEAVLETLRRQPEVDGRHIGIAGHSEGGLIAISLGAKLGAGKIAGLALLSTAGRPLSLVIEDQIEALLKKQTSDAAIQKQYMDNLRDAIAHVEAKGTRPPNVLPGLAALFSPGTGKYLQTVFTIDPANLLARYDGNILVVQGESDIQISPEKDFPILKRTTEARGKGRSQYILVPSASHNLKQVSSLTEAGTTGPVVKQAADSLALWVLNNI
ncbi:alpha/beta fold hydrolase [soil metagenome]